MLFFTPGTGHQCVTFSYFFPAVCRIGCFFRLLLLVQNGWSFSKAFTCFFVQIFARKKSAKPKFISSCKSRYCWGQVGVCPLALALPDTVRSIRMSHKLSLVDIRFSITLSSSGILAVTLPFFCLQRL